MSIIQVFSKYYRLFYPANNFSELYAPFRERTLRANHHAGHYICGVVDPGPATVTREQTQKAVKRHKKNVNTANV